MSDVGLHKICRKHAVPTPPLGRWAKQQAGKKVRRTPLPSAASEISDRIVIAAPELRGETAEVARARDAARVVAFHAHLIATAGSDAPTRVAELLRWAEGELTT